MHSLVLGASGQLGANLVRALLARGDQVRVFLRPSSRTQTLDGLSVEHVHGDLRDEESVHRACRHIQVVYQAASYYPTSTIPVEQARQEALAQTRNLLNAVRAHAVSRLIFTSSLTTIGFPTTPGQLADETCPFSTKFRNNPYLVAKAAMEDEVLHAARKGDVPAVVIVPTAFYGPYDSKPTSGSQIIMIAKRKMPGYLPGLINVIDVRDVAAAMIRAAERGRIGERYIVGNWNATQKDLNRVIAEIAGVKPPVFPVPFFLARWGSKVGEWVSRSVLHQPPPIPAFFVEVLRHMQHYNCSKALQELDYPRSPIAGAIRDALEWFRANGYV